MQPGEGQRLGKITTARMWIEFAGRDLHDDGAGKAARGQQFQDLGAGLRATTRDEVFVANQTGAIGQMQMGQPGTEVTHHL